MLQIVFHMEGNHKLENKRDCKNRKGKNKITEATPNISTLIISAKLNNEFRLSDFI